MRKLVTLRKVDEVQPVPNADAIEHVRVDGWWVVCKKNEFRVGDLALFFEIDSWVPTAIAPFLSKGKEPRSFNGVQGERLRTVRLRGALSQGLLLNPADFDLVLEFDKDYAEELNVQKWEPPIPAQLRGQIKGYFPAFIRKTDQERIQNLPKVFDDLSAEYEVTLKLDGSSISVYCNQGMLGVCSRNIELKLDDENNTFVRTAMERWLPVAQEYYYATGRSIALQGELMGPGIQGNREGFEEHKLFLFDIWDIDNQCYFKPRDRLHWFVEYEIQHVPIFDEDRLEFFGSSIEDLLKHVEFLDYTYSWRCPIEGMVFKRQDGQFSFKVINNKFLEGKK